MDEATQDAAVRAADRLARRLAEAGCRFAFGIPGGEVLVLIDALEAAGIRFVLAKHETAAGFMAEATWHRTGAPGILVATVGPGLSNAVNVVANARLDRVPLIVLAGCVDADDALTYTHQVIDHARLLEPAIKAAYTLTPQSADLITERALSAAVDGRPGPVLIDLPVKVAGATAPGARHHRRTPPSPAAPAAGPALERARGWLERAERPLLIAGFDAVLDDAGDALRAFVERHRVPVIQTYKAKGLLPEDHPLALAPAALSPVADARLLPLVEAADLIVLAGYDPIEMRPSWQSPWDPAASKVVELTAVANDHYMHQATMSFVCHVGAGLDALGAGVEGASLWTAEEVAEHRRAILEPLRVDEAWGPAAIVDTARRVVPRDTVASVDAGAHRILFSQLWRCFEPRTLLQSNGLCTMGCALPLAMGAGIAEPDRPAVAFMGDGGLLMCLGELATCAERNLDLIVVVFVDHSLALIEKKQREVQLKPAGVALGGFDLARVAEGLGGHGITVTSREALTDALESARARAGFSLIACVFDAGAYDGRI